MRRLCLDGSNRQPKFILLSLRDALARAGSIEGLALESALWCRYCAGTTEAGETIAANDPNWDALTLAAQEARGRPGAWLEQRAIYGDLGQDARFAEAFSRWLSHVWDNGTESALKAYLDG